MSFGRFVPDHFDTAIVQGTSPIPCPTGLTCPSNSTGANGLLYANQAFSLLVSAKNANGTGATTTNYQGSLAKPITISAWGAAGSALAANPGGGSITNNSLAAAAFVSGVGTTSAPAYGLGAVTSAPADVYFRVVDTDNITSLRTGAVEAGLKVANGRIKVSNAYGSERLALPITTTVQYYDGSDWLTSLTDNTTSFNSNLSTAAGNVVTSTVNGLSGGIAIVNPTTAAMLGGVRTFNVAAPLVSGSASILINAPSYLPSTTGLVTFGIFKSPLIYRRENY